MSVSRLWPLATTDACFRGDAQHPAVDRTFDDVLHLHRLEDGQRLAGADHVANLDLDRAQGGLQRGDDRALRSAQPAGACRGAGADRAPSRTSGSASPPLAPASVLACFWMNRVVASPASTTGSSKQRPQEGDVGLHPLDPEFGQARGRSLRRPGRMSAPRRSPWPAGNRSSGWRRSRRSHSHRHGCRDRRAVHRR